MVTKTDRYNNALQNLLEKQEILILLFSVFEKFTHSSNGIVSVDFPSFLGLKIKM